MEQGMAKKSRRWLAEHERDAYVRAARKSGYRSRASYKLLEIQQKYSVLRSGQTVLDLGAAPGGWSQVAKEITGGNGMVIAVDLLKMQPIPGVIYLQGDFTEEVTVEQIRKTLDGTAPDLVISDMAPNLSGMKEIDQPRIVYLVELALAMAQEILSPQGALLVKCFQGAGIDPLRQAFQQSFLRFNNIKPAASRDRSREIYLLGRGLKT